MKAFGAKMLARRVRPVRAARFRAWYVACVLTYTGALPCAFVLMLIIGPLVHRGFLFVLILMPVLAAGVLITGYNFQRALGEPRGVSLFFGCLAAIPVIGALVMVALLVESGLLVDMARRIRCGQCPVCEYGLRATPPSAPCPECGYLPDDRTPPAPVPTRTMST